MIQEIKIKNFLSFKDEVTFSFEATKAGDKSDKGYSRENDPLVIKVSNNTFLLRFATIYGANASGKTNLLSAFNFIFEFLTSKPIFADSGIGIQHFALDNSYKEENTEFNLKFFINDERYWYQLIVNKERIVKENLYIYKSIQPSSIFKREYDKIEFNQNIEPIDSFVQKQLNVNCLKNMSVFIARKTVNTTLPLVDTIGNWIESTMADMIEDSYNFFAVAERYVQKDEQLSEYLVNFLKVADFNISRIESEMEKKEIPEEIIQSIFSDPVAPEQLKQQLMKDKHMTKVHTYFHHTTINNGVKEDHRFPSSWQSRGTKNVFSIETLLYLVNKKEDGFIAIDELERSLHPLLMKYIVKRFISEKGKKSQLLISSHFTSLLDMPELRKDCFWFAEKNHETGISSITPLTKKKALNRRRSIEDGYLIAGNFGANPKIEE